MKLERYVETPCKEAVKTMTIEQMIRHYIVYLDHYMTVYSYKNVGAEYYIGEMLNAMKIQFSKVECYSNIKILWIDNGDWAYRLNLQTNELWIGNNNNKDWISKERL